MNSFLSDGFGCTTGVAIARGLMSAPASAAHKSPTLDPAVRAERIAQISEWFDNRPNDDVFLPFRGVSDQTTDNELRVMPVNGILEDVVTGVFEHLKMKIGRTVGDLMDLFGLNGLQLRSVGFVGAPKEYQIGGYAVSVAWDGVLEHEQYAYMLKELRAFVVG